MAASALIFVKQAYGLLSGTRAPAPSWVL